MSGRRYHRRKAMKKQHSDPLYTILMVAICIIVIAVSQIAKANVYCGPAPPPPPGCKAICICDKDTGKCSWAFACE